MKGLVKEYIFIPHGHSQKFGQGQERGRQEWVELGKKRGRGGTPANMATLKIKIKTYF